MNNHTIIESYYRAHKDELLSFVSARLHNNPEAEDVVQEAFLRLLSGSWLISEATLPHLAYTLCRNLVADWYRRHSVRLDAEHELACTDQVGDSAESLLSMHETTEQLERCMARMSEESRTIYRMHIYDSLPIREICLMTGKPYKAVEYRLGQARKQVRTNLRHVI